MNFKSVHEARQHIENHPNCDLSSHTVNGEAIAGKIRAEVLDEDDSEDVVRVPVTVDYAFQIFGLAVIRLAKQGKGMGEELLELFHGMASLGEDDVIPAKVRKRPKKGQGRDLQKERQFIKIFTKRYAEYYGNKYPDRIDAINVTQIGNLLPKLQEIGVETEEYLDWLFRVFLKGERDDSFYHPLFVRSACSNKLFARFQYHHKRTRRQKPIDPSGDLLKRARVLFKRTKDKEIGMAIERCEGGELAEDGLLQLLIVKSRKYRKQDNGKKA